PAAARRFEDRYFREGRGAGEARLRDIGPSLLRDAESAAIDVPQEVRDFVLRVRDAADAEQRRRENEAEVRSAGGDQPGVRVPLYPYQVEGVAFLASRGRALLAD